MKTFFSGIRDWITGLWESGCRLAKSLFVTLVIPIVVIGMDILGLFMGAPILVSAVLGGMVLCISIFFILVGMPAGPRARTTKFIGRYGFWIDLVLTTVLTIAGFKMGATLGLVAMLMGLNISALTAMIRVACMITDEQLRDEFIGEANLPAKKRSKLQTEPFVLVDTAATN